MSIFNQIVHLLPNARAWRITIEKTLRKFFEGLADGLTGPVEYFDDIYDDVFPGLTRNLAEYEAQFGLTPGSLTEQQRRDRLAAEWAATGGQSPAYIQSVIQSAGFTDVFIHEWWVPGTNTPRDPNVFITDPEFMLVNKREAWKPDFISYGGDYFYGDALSFYGGQNGNFLAKELKEIPSDPATFPFFLYFGGETYLDYADVPAARRDEFEALLLKLCPAQLWIGLRINYI
jgi:hypothetical protein